MRRLWWLTTCILVALAGQSAWAVPDGRPGATFEERQLGALAADQLIRQHGIYFDEAMQTRLDRIGATLTRYAPGGPMYKFKILRSDDVNAMTTPDGTVFVTRTLMRSFKEDGDLAAVLAHEISHVMLGHTAKLLTEPDEVREVTVTRKNGKSNRRTVTITSEKKKNWEFEADAEGIELLQSAGYNAIGMEHVLEFLTAEEGRLEARRPAPAATEADTSTHPRSADRLASLRKLLGERAAHQRDPGPPPTGIDR